MYKLIKFLEEMEKAPYRESMRYVHKIPRLIERSYRKPRTQKSGVRPTLYMVNPNGKWVSKIYDSAYGYSNKKAAAGERL